jgi:hypothetical protein
MIPVYFFSATDSRVGQFDDPGYDADDWLVTPDPPSIPLDVRAKLLTGPIIEGQAGGWSTLRRLIQWIAVGASATIQVTPVTDGSENSDNMQSKMFSAGVDGPVSPWVVPLAARGTRHQLLIEVTHHAGRCSLGEAEVQIIPRRTAR